MLDKMQARRLQGDKEVKVRIDPGLHLQLQDLKIREGQRIQETVARALSNYFEQLREDAEEEAQARSGQ